MSAIVSLCSRITSYNVCYTKLLRKGFKETADDLRKSVEPEINMIQQEVKMVEQDFQASMKEAEEEITNVGKDVEQKSGNQSSQA